MSQPLRLAIKPRGYLRRTRQGKHSPEAKAYHAWMNDVRTLARAEFDRPVKLGDCVAIEFFHATKDKRKWGQPKRTKPDVDNLAKAVIDALAEGNDSHVYYLEAGKFWAEKDEIIIYEGIELT